MEQPRKPWYQHLIVIAAGLFAAFIFTGALLDSAGNALSLVPPRVALTLTTLLIGGALVLHPVLRKWPLRWVTRSGTVADLSGIGPRPIGALAGIVLLLWIPVLSALLRNASTDAPLPLIEVRLSNPGTEPVAVFKRAECVLWLPSGVDDGLPRINAKCQLVTRPPTVSHAIVVQAGHRVRVWATFTNQARFRHLYDGGEADLTLIVRDGNGAVHTSGEVPFTASDLGRYFLEIDVSSQK